MSHDAETDPVDPGRPPRRPPRGVLVALWDDREVVARLPAEGEGDVVAGRGAGCQLQVDHGSVSREHARIHAEGGAAWITDLGSRNGTWIRERRLEPHKPARLRVEVGARIGNVTVYLQGAGALEARPARFTGDVEYPPDVFVTRDAPMGPIFRLVERSALSSIAVLILGETGTGKDVIASSIHHLSGRRGLLVTVNCAAIPDSMFEAELFGYEKNAFTGASAAKPGLIETAENGTLFLDEVGELSMAAQAKLLTVLQNGQVRRLGAVTGGRVRFRVVAATNRDLEEEVARGAFRKDLYFRLCQFTITVPPLATRQGEIVALASRFLAKHCEEAGREPLELTEAAGQALLAYAWPGNVRELEHAMRHAAMLAEDGVVDTAHLQLGPRRGANDPLPATPKDAERARILGVLGQCGGNQTLAAKTLGISLRSLVRRLDEWGVPRPKKGRPRGG